MERIREEHPSQTVEVWFEDEARLGQQGSLTKVWAPKGSRPQAVRQTEYKNIYILSAVCPAKGQAEGMFFPSLNSEVMNHFLDQLSQGLSVERHRVLILDRAGYHLSKRLVIPPNITLIYLPPYSPELNPVENLWHYLRSHYWSNRYYKDLSDVESAAQEAWEMVCLDEEKIQSICSVHYVH